MNTHREQLQLCEGLSGGTCSVSMASAEASLQSAQSRCCGLSLGWELGGAPLNSMVLEATGKDLTPENPGLL